MITYGYAKNYKYISDGTLQIQVRIPSIHGAYKQSNYQGKTIRNYTDDIRHYCCHIYLMKGKLLH